MTSGSRYPVGPRRITEAPTEKGASPVSKGALAWKSGSPHIIALSPERSNAIAHIAAENISFMCVRRASFGVPVVPPV